MASGPGNDAGRHSVTASEADSALPLELAKAPPLPPIRLQKNAAEVSPLTLCGDTLVSIAGVAKLNTSPSRGW